MSSAAYAHRVPSHSSHTSTTNLAGLMATTMAAATIVVNSIGILASELIEEFALSRAEVGGLVTSFGIIAALLSVPAGRFTDRVGGRLTLVIVYVFSAMALFTLALASNYALLAIALAFGGVANAGAHPGTNQLIGEHVPAGRQGLVTGVKMSGVQIGVFAAGIGLPIGFSTIGWRPSIAVIGLAPLIGMGWLLAVIPRSHPVRDDDTEGVTPAGVGRLAVYTFLMSAATAAMITYLPLYAQERLGMGQASAGFTVALVGIVAVIGRVTWGTITERVIVPTSALQWVSLGSAVATGGLLMTGSVSSALLWPVVLLIGATAASYNAAATMVLLRVTPQAAMGRASGVIFAGFLAGLAAGPVTFGAIVDARDGYPIAWWSVVVAFTVALLIARFGLDTLETLRTMGRRPTQ